MITDRFRLDGRTAVVTGAAGGLGRAFACALAEAGAHVACLDCDELALSSTVAAIGTDRALGITVDVSSPEGVDDAVAQIVAWSGKIDILVNNAGIATAPVRTHEIPISDWDRVIAVNLGSVFLCTRALLPTLMKSGAASIIHLGSLLGLTGAYPGFPVSVSSYASSKAAIEGFSRQVAIEYAKDGIRSNVIAPGWHGGTNLGREAHAAVTPEYMADFEKFIVNSVPMGHFGKPDDLVGLLLYLASDASRYLTGQIIAHDGGLTAA